MKSLDPGGSGSGIPGVGIPFIPEPPGGTVDPVGASPIWPEQPTTKRETTNAERADDVDRREDMPNLLVRGIPTCIKSFYLGNSAHFFMQKSAIVQDIFKKPPVKRPGGWTRRPAHCDGRSW
jgi:hypothetical protein